MYSFFLVFHYKDTKLDPDVICAIKSQSDLSLFLPIHTCLNKWSGREVIIFLCSMVEWHLSAFGKKT